MQIYMADLVRATLPTVRIRVVFRSTLVMCPAFERQGVTAADETAWFPIEGNWELREALLSAALLYCRRSAPHSDRPQYLGKLRQLDQSVSDEITRYEWTEN